MKIKSIWLMCYFLKNHKIRIAVFICVCLFLSFNQVNAQDWNLDSCITYANKHNPELQKLQLNTYKAETRLNATKYNYYPSLNARIRSGSNFGLYIDPTTNILDFGNNYVNSFQLGADVDIFNGFYNKYNKLWTEGKKTTSQYLFEKKRNEIALDIIQTYYNILLFQESTSYIKQRQAVLEKKIKYIEGAVNAGILHKRDLLFFNYLSAQDDAQLIKAENAIKHYYSLLYYLLGFDNDANFTIKNSFSDVVPTSEIIDYNAIINESVKNFPHLKIGNLMVQNAEILLQLNRTALYPSLSLVGVWGSKTSSQNTMNSFGTQIRDNNYQYIGFQLDIPIFNHNRVKTNIALATFDVEIAKISALQLSLELKNIVYTAVLEYNNTLKLYEAHQKKYETVKEEFNYANKRFDLGDIGIYELSEITSRLITSENEVLETKYNLVLKSKVLDFYRRGHIH